MSTLQDSFGRRFSYLRLSLTDVCNFRCAYCLPNGYCKKEATQAPLSSAEIENLAAGFAALGVKKIRLTGGEPTVRTDLPEIVRRLSGVPGILDVAVTTNGTHLDRIAPVLKAAGLTGLNVSVDSLDRGGFSAITGHDRLEEVLRGVETAERAGISSVKVNVVLLKGINDHQFGAFQEWIRARSIGVRFIELMETSDNREFFRKHHAPVEPLQRRLLTDGWISKARSVSQGPAVEFVHPEFRGTLGFIAPYSKDFCQSCNRLRISSQGALRLCLFGQGEYSLRRWLQAPNQQEELQRQICSVLERKPKAHRLHEGILGNNANLAAIGG